MRAIHWFRNDLRLRDNTALRAAAERADELLPIFVIDPRLLRTHTAAARRNYLGACLNELAESLAEAGCPLLIVRDDPVAIIPRLIRECGADLLTFNRDYSPYAVRRDQRVSGAAQDAGAKVESFKDKVLFEADEVLTKNGTPFRVYSPYRRAWLAKSRAQSPSPSGPPKLPRPVALPACAKPASLDCEPSEHIAGESAALARLREFVAGDGASYETGRDLPARDATSRLSAALRFGAVSPRTCIEAARKQARKSKRAVDGLAKWVDELVWREFYQALLASHPEVLERSFRPETRAVEWNDDEESFAAWCEGRTGFPMVDAGMRQLVSTGWMHNRARMITASFLVKDLLIDWQRGERFFMEHLVDGDPAANNGGWQWAASTGTDAQPYFRVFNPTTQGRKFDPDGTYVRRFVPELADLPSKHIHDPGSQRPGDYPEPIVDHAERRVVAIARFAAAKDQN